DKRFPYNELLRLCRCTCDGARRRPRRVRGAWNHEGPVSDDAFRVARGVGGGPEVEQLDGEVLPARELHESAKREDPARVFLAERGRVPRDDGLRRVPVEPAGGLDAVVVAEVGAHDDQRAGFAEERFDEIRRLLGRQLRDGDGQEAEPRREDPLQERELHLERVLGGVRPVVDRRTARYGPITEDGIDGHLAEGRRPGVRYRNGRAADRDVVYRPQSDD